MSARINGLRRSVSTATSTPLWTSIAEASRIIKEFSGGWYGKIALPRCDATLKCENLDPQFGQRKTCLCRAVGE